MHIDRHPHEDPLPRLDSWDRKFEGLQRRISRLAADRRRRLGARLLEIRSKKNELERRLRRAAHGTRASWERARHDLDDAGRDFRSLSRQVRDRARRTG